MDIGLVWDNTNAYADIGVADGDLAGDDTLRTAVILSLFQNRLANADDVIPGAIAGVTPDRQGSWMDSYPLPGAVPGDLRGSRLYLLLRAGATVQTANDARAYVLECLQWMLDDGVAASMTVQTQWITSLLLGIVITIMQRNGTTIASRHFDFQWAATLAAPDTGT